MSDFKENQCRCCKKFFCCKKCRGRHENLEHGVFPDCDICLYGKAVLTNASENLLEHVKCVHWPLRCVFCKRFFGTTDELKRHNKCPVGFKIGEDLEKSPYTPGQSYNESLYDSPPLSLLFPKGQQPNKNLNMFSNLATSTPMQRCDDNNLLEQIQEAITPVDYSESDKKESLTKGQQNPDNTSLKRRVTFCETPMSESYRKQKNTLKKKQYQERDSIPSGPFSGNGSSGIFYSVKEEPQEESDLKQNSEVKGEEREKFPAIIVEECEDKENIEAKHEDSTLWISAVNVTSDIIEEKHDCSPEYKTPNAQAAVTPMASKLKKRQVNIVMPTPVTKNSERNLENDTEIRPGKSDSTDNNNTEPNVKISPTTDNSLKTDEENTDPSNNIPETISETSLNAVQNRLWTSMSKLIKNVASALQSVSTISEDIPNNLKRRSSDYDLIYGPSAKRYKLTEIKCRRTIRELPRTESVSWEIHESYNNSYKRKTYVDKSTQTDDYLLEDELRVLRMKQK